MFVYFIAFALCIVGSSAVPTPENVDTNFSLRIIGGTASNPADHPYIAFLMYNGRQVCAATIISDRHVITAAHCVFTYGIVDPATKFTIKVISSSTTYKVLDIHYNGYNPDRKDKDPMMDDVVVLKLITNPLNRLKNKIELKNENVAGDVTLVGWGSIKPGGDFPQTLQEVSLKILLIPDCQAEYNKKRVTESQICTSTLKEGKPVGICHGDSGGPLIKMGATTKENRLVGIVSWGIPCGRGKPDVYTNINLHYDWIITTLNL